MRWASIVSLSVLLFLSATVTGDPEEAVVGDSGVDMKRVDAAVKRGVEWLLSKQNADGSWTVTGGSQLQQIEGNYPGGSTALALLALLKGGVSPKDARIRKGFYFCLNEAGDLPLKGAGKAPAGKQGVQMRPRTYSVSVLILALAAKYQPRIDPKKHDEEDKLKLKTTPVREQMRKGFKRASGRDKEAMGKLIAWLIKAQEKNVWRYPGPAQDGNREDASNTQYAMLALYTGLRLGYPIPKEVFARVADYFLQYQEKDGADVKWFPVPGADVPISKMRKMERNAMKALKKLAKETKGDLDKIKTDVVVDNPYKDFGDEKRKMKARGWGYIPKGKAGQYKSFELICGSMTTSGVAAMMVCKSALEGTGYWRKRRKAIEQAIRDGVAWLSSRFDVGTNPGKGHYHYYYLYGLERAGVLTLTRYMGKHDWYKEGAEFLLGHQRGDGSWQEGGSTGESTLVSTCFAILFLKKATAPVVRLPTTVFSGKGIFGDGKK